jgi:hypothetical protein
MLWKEDKRTCLDKKFACLDKNQAQKNGNNSEEADAEQMLLFRGRRC